MSRSSVQSTASSVGTVARSAVLFSGGGQGHADGAALGAKYAFPQGVCVFGTNTYIADTSNHVVRAVDEYGAVRTLCGSPGEPGHMDGRGNAARFNLPAALCCDAKGNLIVTDEGKRVRHVTPDGVVTTLWDAKAQDGSVSDPKLANVSLRGVCCTPDTIYLTCTSTHSVIALPLIAAVAAATSSSAAAAAAAVGAGAAAGAGSADGTRAASASSAHKHAKAHIVAGGNGPGFANGNPLESQFHSPHGIDADSEGHLYVSDTHNHCIRRVTSRQVTTYAGVERHAGLKDGSAHKALFHKPYGVCWDARSHCVLVSDGVNRALRRVGDSGSSSSGGDVRTVAHLDFEPYDVCVDGDGNVLLNAPWSHQFFKIMLDDQGQLRGSLTESAISAANSARSSAIGVERDSTMQQALKAAARDAHGHHHHRDNGAAPPPLETRITFNFGDAKAELTQALVPGHKHDRELSITSLSPSAGPLTRQPTVESLGSPTHAQVAAAAELKADAQGKMAGAAAGKDDGHHHHHHHHHHHKDKAHKKGSASSKKKADLSLSTDPASPGSDEVRSPISPTTPDMIGNPNANADAAAKEKDDSDKSCRMCQKDCTIM